MGSQKKQDIQNLAGIANDLSVAFLMILDGRRDNDRFFNVVLEDIEYTIEIFNEFLDKYKRRV